MPLIWVLCNHSIIQNAFCNFIVFRRKTLLNHFQVYFVHLSFMMLFFSFLKKMPIVVSFAQRKNMTVSCTMVLLTRISILHLNEEAFIFDSRWFHSLIDCYQCELWKKLYWINISSRERSTKFMFCFVFIERKTR